jgi:hypothetical protein
MALRREQDQAEDYPLRAEEEFFDAHRAEWLKDHRGEVALVKGSKLLGFYPTIEEAFQAGVEQIGYQDMLIKDVLETDSVQIISSVW